MVCRYGLVSAVGATVAPFYLAPVLCVLYYLCALPLPSSFHAIKPSVATGKPADPATQISLSV